ncbi:MAG: 3-phosphoserine/phosphohydroxythreonine transaminase, partial [Rhodothermales bacterium]
MMEPVKYDSPRAEDRPVRLHNFSAGPGALPEPVLREIRSELPVYRNAGASIMEISHRSPEYSAIEENAKSLLRELLGLGSDWHILFLQGGASMQFHQVPLNFLSEGRSADYLVTGSWASKALKEARIVGSARESASSKDRNFSYIPARDSWVLDTDAQYLHFTSNNTIFGTQFQTEPDVEVPLVCDASSDFLSRRLQIDRYGLIYAGAQKNLGPAGVTVVMIRDDFLQGKRSSLPTILDYGTHTSGLFNTPPVFAVYAVEKVLR